MLLIFPFFLKKPVIARDKIPIIKIKIPISFLGWSIKIAKEYEIAIKPKRKKYAGTKINTIRNNTNITYKINMNFFGIIQCSV